MATFEMNVHSTTNITAELDTMGETSWAEITVTAHDEQWSVTTFFDTRRDLVDVMERLSESLAEQVANLEE